MKKLLGVWLFLLVLSLNSLAQTSNNIDFIFPLGDTAQISVENTVYNWLPGDLVTIKLGRVNTPNYAELASTFQPTRVIDGRLQVFTILPSQSAPLGTGLYRYQASYKGRVIFQGSIRWSYQNASTNMYQVPVTVNNGMVNVPVVVTIGGIGPRGEKGDKGESGGVNSIAGLQGNISSIPTSAVAGLDAILTSTLKVSAFQSYTTTLSTDLSNRVSTTAFNSYTATTATALQGKQNTLTFDSAPINGSANPVTSGGIATALSNLNTAKADATATTNALNGKVDNSAFTAFQASNAQAIDSKATLVKGKLPAGTLRNNAKAPSVQFRHTLAGYVQPEINTATLTFSRNFETPVRLASGLWASASHQTAAYTWDEKRAKNRYKSTGQIANNIPYSAASTNRDLAQPGWTLTGCTATKTAAGVDGASNAATTLTATANNATALYSVTQAAATRTFSVNLRRISGVGSVYITRDGGATWKNITLQINGQGYTQVSLTSSVLNPSFGIRLDVQGDVIAVDAAQDTNTAYPVDPMFARGSQELSNWTIAFSNPLPNNRYYRANFRMKLKSGQGSIDFGQPGVNGVTITALLSDINDNSFNVQSFSNSVLQHNATVRNRAVVEQLQNTGATFLPVTSGDELDIRIYWGQGKITLYVNNLLQYYMDAPGKLDPLSIDRVAFRGEGEFSDVSITELHPNHIAVIGHSITAAEGLAVMLLQNLDPDQYQISLRGIGGNTLADIDARLATDLTPTFNPTATSNSVLFWGATNTLANNVSGVDALSQASAIFTKIKAGAAWNRIIAVKELLRGGGFNNGTTTTSFAAQVAIYNAGLTAAGADEVLDLSVVDGGNDIDNINLYDSSKIHPKSILYQRFWPLIRERID